eukprot:12889446-Prorocentrum_lima.AAC.1
MVSSRQQLPAPAEKRRRGSSPRSRHDMRHEASKEAQATCALRTAALAAVSASRLAVRGTTSH